MGSLHYIKIEHANAEIDTTALNKSDSILHLLDEFQTQQNFKALLEVYFENVASMVGIEGMCYEYPLLGIHISLGNLSHRARNYHLTRDEQNLGNIAIYRKTDLSTSEFDQFELITALLIIPLRTIILSESSKLMTSEGNLVAIANPSMIEQLVTREAKLAFRDSNPMSIIVFNVDRLDQIIESSGLMYSDKLLYEVMSIAYSRVRSTDLLMRYNQDSFCLVLRGVTGFNALQVSERMRNAIDKHDFKKQNGKPLHITISSGVAELTTTDNLDYLFERAKQALTLAHSRGCNNSQLADNVFLS